MRRPCRRTATFTGSGACRKGPTVPMPSPEPLEIRRGPFVARFAPQNGGRMTHLRHAAMGDILVPTPDASFDPLYWPKAGAYPLFPYHNRLIGAAFVHEGRRYLVKAHPALGTDAVHGPAHRRPWHVISRGDDRLVLALDYQADEDWPFDFRATQAFRLHPDGLEVVLTLGNTGREDMPSGFGWHPYFAAGLGKQVFCDAAKRWPLDAVGIPSGVPPEARAGNEPFPDEAFTEHLSEWSRAAAVLDGGAQITLAGDWALPHLVAHRMPSYICLEPVSHVAGAFGFPPHSRAETGLRIQAPGEERSARISLRMTAKT
ncbi:galactose mutarotase [Sinorhizobium sp. BJ1]|nr:galactose mutarotase [Sinorhizobium sp. BJ1]